MKNIEALLENGGKLYARADDFYNQLYFWSTIPEKHTAGLLAELSRDKSGLIQISFLSEFDVNKSTRYLEDTCQVPKSGEVLFLSQANREASEIFGTSEEIDRYFMLYGAHDARRIRRNLERLERQGSEIKLKTK